METPLLPTPDPRERPPSPSFAKPEASVAVPLPDTVVLTARLGSRKLARASFRKPAMARRLDSRNYPLANTPTPPIFRRFHLTTASGERVVCEETDAHAATTMDLTDDVSTPTEPLGSPLRKRQASPPSAESQHRPCGTGSDSLASPAEDDEPSSPGALRPLAYRHLQSPPHKRPKGRSPSAGLNLGGTPSHRPVGLGASRPGYLASDDDDEGEVSDDVRPAGNTVAVDAMDRDPSPDVPSVAATSPRVEPREPAEEVRSTCTLPSPCLSPRVSTEFTRAAGLPSPASVAPSGFDGDDSSYFGPSLAPPPAFSMPPVTPAAGIPSLADVSAVIAAFDAYQPALQTYVMFHLLQRCSAPTLQFANTLITPVLHRDFIADLPGELVTHVLRFLDAPSLCRAAQVSRKWKTAVDTSQELWVCRLAEDQLVDPIAQVRDSAAASFFRGVPAAKLPVGGDLPRDEQYRAHLLDSLTGPSGPSPQLASPSIVTSTSSGTALALATTADDESDPFGPAAAANGRMVLSSTRSRASAPAPPKLTGYHPWFANFIATAELRGDLNRQQRRLRDLYLQHGLPAAFPLPNPCKLIYGRHFEYRRNWDRLRYRKMQFMAKDDNIITCLQFDDHKIVSGSDGEKIYVYETRTGNLLRQLSGHSGGVWTLQYVGNTLVSGSTDRSVRVWDIERGRCTHIFTGHTSTVRCLQILLPMVVGRDGAGRPIIEPKQPLIVTGSRDSTLRVWKLPVAGRDFSFPATVPPAGTTAPAEATDPARNPYFMHLLQGHTMSVRTLVGKGRIVVSGSYDATVRVWDVMEGTCLWRLTGHMQRVYSVALADDRKRCMSGSLDSNVRVWSLVDGTCLYVLEGHHNLVGLLQLTPNYLISAGADSTLRVWRNGAFIPLHVLTAHVGTITCFYNDDRYLVSGSENGLKMWNVRTGQLVCDLLTDVTGIWQARFDQRRCVAAVQRETTTFFEVFDFGAEGLLSGSSSSSDRDEAAVVS
ncbi:SCF ubiquitin ligase complex subunit cdc4 [Tieghemiomyces parasiticus]|uniref:SCF ubiquitin ligase complex subunit cdc4 n=1 Tax=Tieghemiomyces parasiticus TaxID=78921 RepID=A0A9W8A3B2_9FUNG|nr:SCF ubiquitin ligase complex subunit cdc4 [Tieghemiomyces parasiticus]